MNLIFFDNPVFQVVLFAVLASLLFFISRQTINQFFFFFRRFIHNEQIIFSLVTMLFLPGTIIHELSHMLVATMLFHRVREVNIFPKWQGNYIKLGSVIYEKKDVIRSIFIGIAPFFFGLYFFWFIAHFKLFPQQNLLINVLILYLIYVVSSTMFSSKQDLVDIIYIIPLLIFIAFIVYVFDIRIGTLPGASFLISAARDFLKVINRYLFYSLILNISLIILLKGLQQVKPK